jgi:ATP-dependent Lon protease
MNDKDNSFTSRRSLPVLPLRGLSVFPGMLLNFDVERQMSVAALNTAMGSDQIIFLTAQKDITKDMPFGEDIYRIGTVCRVRQLLRQPGNQSIRVMAEGLARGRVVDFTMDKPSLCAEIEPMPDKYEKSTLKTEALCRRACSLFADYAEASGNVSPSIVINIMASSTPPMWPIIIAQNIYLKPAEKQRLLEELRPSHRLSELCRMLTREIMLLGVEHDISERTQEQVNRSQRDTTYGSSSR